MEYISDWIVKNFGLSFELQERLLSSFFVIFILIVVRKIVLVFVQRGTKDVAVRYRWRKGTTYFAFGLSVLIIGSIWLRGFQSLTTYIAVVSAGLAIALQVPLVNLAGWVFIIWRKPFSVGDRIEIGSVKGDVVDLRIFMFTVLEIGNWVDAEQSTGRVIHVPNGKVFSEPIANYTESFRFIWNEIAVLVTFESNWEAAKELLSEISIKHGEAISISAEKEIKN
ncbi:MAG: mechanosensitive ion channel family protein, partial [Pyrinomonadaceae bacterium]